MNSPLMILQTILHAGRMLSLFLLKWPDLNRQPSRCKRVALAVELHFNIVAPVRFERTTPALKERCYLQLSYETIFLLAWWESNADVFSHHPDNNFYSSGPTHSQGLSLLPLPIGIQAIVAVLMGVEPTLPL